MKKESGQQIKLNQFRKIISYQTGTSIKKTLMAM